MEKKKLLERDLMSEEEFKDYMEKNRVDIVKDFYEKNILHLKSLDAINKFKSIRRAIKRGHVSVDGIIYPNRPFNNRKHGKSSLNNRKRVIYEQLKYKQSIR